jgi:hypothetical protein
MGTKINLYKQSGTDDGTSVNFNVPRSLTYGLNARANDDGGVSESDNCEYNILNTLYGINYEPIPIQPETAAYLAATGITGTTEVNAINKLVYELKQNNLWSKMKAVYPFVTDNRNLFGYTENLIMRIGLIWGAQLELGSTATTYQPIATTQQAFISSQFKYNLVNPVDSDAAFRLVFNGGWTHSSNGATPNGTNNFADTKLIPINSIASQNSTHLSYYANTNAKNPSFQIGVRGGVVQSDLFIGAKWTATQNFNAVNNDTTPALNTETLNVNGFIAVSRINSTTFKYYKGNTLAQTNTKVSSALPNTYPIWIGALNYSGTILYPDTSICAFSTIGDGLTDTEAAILYSLVQQYQTFLNRAV